MNEGACDCHGETLVKSLVATGKALAATGFPDFSGDGHVLERFLKR